MIDSSAAAFGATAAGVGILHTLMGPDHYLPLVFMSRASGWSRARTLAVTLACGIGHVLSSIVLGAVGIALGLTASRLKGLESVRGELAAWGLLAFGLAYGLWGLRRGLRERKHAHLHAHPDGSVHRHPHAHHGEHTHVHALSREKGGPLTSWFLFILFVLGPCEPLIPLLLVPAAQREAGGILWVVIAFGSATLLTMIVAVTLGLAGLRALPFGPLARFPHVVAGAALAACGVAILFFGV